MKRLSLLLLGILSSLLLLTGCYPIPTLNISAEKQKVTNYNLLVAKTLANYVEYKGLAKKEQNSLISFLLSNKRVLPLAGKALSVTPLTQKEFNSFKQYHFVSFNHYFTALGASGVREVLIIDSQNYRMYVTLIWGNKVVIYLNREVIAS
jgi:hypothetical protein